MTHLVRHDWSLNARNKLLIIIAESHLTFDIFMRHPANAGSIPIRPDRGKDGRVAEIRVAVGEFPAQLFIEDVNLSALGVAVGAIVVVAVLQVDGQGKPRLPAGVRIAGMQGPSMVETYLSLFQNHGHDANVLALFAKFLLQLREVLVVEKTDLLQTLPPMAPGHDHERAARYVHRVERNPPCDQFV